MVSKPSLIAIASGLLVNGLLLFGLRSITEPHDAYDMGIVATLLMGSVSFFVGSMTYVALTPNKR